MYSMGCKGNTGFMFLNWELSVTLCLKEKDQQERNFGWFHDESMRQNLPF